VSAVASSSRLAATSSSSAATSTAPAPASQVSAKPLSIRMMAGDYTPVQQSGTTAAPPQYITKLVSMYQQSHPGFKVDWVVLNNGGQSDTDVWITTQLAGGNPPDIINWQSARIEGILKEKVFQPLDSYLAKPNPYEPGNTQWLASFNPLIMPGKKLVDGQQYVIPLDLVVTGIIYNKQAFAKAGITTPGDWKAWMDQTPVVKSKADLVPISWWMKSDVSRWQWSFACFQDIFLDKKLSSGEITGQPLKRSGNWEVSKEDLARAVKKGTYAATMPEYQDILRVFKDWTPAFTPGFVGIDSATGQRSFIDGQAAQIWGHTGIYRNFKLDTQRKFDMGVFMPPTITSATSQYATTSFPFVGGATATQWAIPTADIKRANADGVVDWLMFLTAAKNAGPLVNDFGGYAPNIVGAPVAADLQVFMDGTKNGTFRISNDNPLTLQYKDQHNRIGQLFLSGSMTQQQAVAEIQKNMVAAADQLFHDNPTWKP
jgi:ABC-type glycerol-3-phosphate transport system substrate-binding protein